MFVLVLFSDHQKLEREARICRLLKHPNIGKFMTFPSLYEPHHEKTCSKFPTRFDTNCHHRAVQPQKMVRGLKFRSKEVEGLYYLFGENKGTCTAQLRGYRTAGLGLCFRIMQKSGFLM